MISAFSISPCACASLRRAGRAVSHLYDLVLAPQAIKTTQFLLLKAIADAAPIAHCELARQFGASEETFSRRLATARRAGWVQMTIDARRRRMYTLTAEGFRLLEAAMPGWERAQDRLRQQLGDTDWSTLIELSDRVTQAAVRAERAPRRNAPPQERSKEPLAAD
ncbi:MAG: MarR family winged helix-turn-helix transcriptional regulator [Acidobacteriota bacterium]